MAIYQVQGPNGEIITIEGPDGANPNDVIAQAQSLYKPKEEKSAGTKFMEPFKDVSVSDWAQKSFLAPALQTMQAVTPFGLLRPDVAAMNLKQGSENLVGKGGQMAQGLANIATSPVQSAQQAYNAVATNPAGVAGEVAKGILYDPEMLIGSGVGTAAEKGLMSAGRGVKNTVQAPINFGRGFTEGYFNPQAARPGVSAMVPLESYYYPEAAASRFTKGEIGLPELERSKVPSASLFNSPTLQKGLNVATKNEAGQPMIPLQGRKMEAFGEQLGREYANKPLAGLVDIAGAIGGMATAGVPLTPSAAMRAYQGFKTRQLGQAANFSPEFAQKYAEAAKAAQTPAQKSMEVAASKINASPMPGPVNPATMPQAPAPAPAPRPVMQQPAPKPAVQQPIGMAELKNLQNQLSQLDDKMTMLRDEHLGRDLSTVENIAYRDNMDKMYSASKSLEKQISELKKSLKIKK